MHPRLAAPILLAAALLALVGCTAGAGPSRVQGETLTVYAGLPLHGPSASRGQAIENGIKLALAEAGGRAGERRVEAVYIDDTDGKGWTQAAAAEAARRASQDITAIGYIGDLESGATRVSLPIANQAEMAHVSPASTAVDLTRAASGTIPQRLQPSGKRTFARVVPADDVQARAAALWAKRLGAKKVAAANDGSVFGKTTAVAFEDGARVVGLKLVAPDHADAIFDGGELRGLPERYVVSPFLDPSQLPPAGQRFVKSYRHRFGAAPDPAAAYGYESMALLLDAIRRAGGGGDDRLKVLDSLLATHNRTSILGHYSLDEYGETTLREVSGYKVKNGHPVVAAKLTAP
jgi:branched-chain amino acid transport system substrate-binding protein